MSVWTVLGSCFPCFPQQNTQDAVPCLQQTTFGLVRTWGEFPLCLATTALSVNGIWLLVGGQLYFGVATLIIGGGTVYSWYEIRNLKRFDQQNDRFSQNNTVYEAQLKKMEEVTKGLFGIEGHLSEDVENLGTIEKSFGDRLTNLVSHLQRFQELQRGMEETKKALEKKIEEMTPVVNAVRQHAQTLGIHVGRIADEVGEFDAENDEFKDNVEDLKAVYEQIAASHNKMKNDLDMIRPMVSQLKEGMSAFAHNHKAMQGEVVEFDQENEELRQTLEKAVEFQKQLSRVCENIGTEVVELKLVEDSLTDKMAILSSITTKFEQQSSLEETIKERLREKEEMIARLNSQLEENQSIIQTLRKQLEESKSLEFAIKKLTELSSSRASSMEGRL